MTNDSSPHSGSRWEPNAGPAEHPTAVDPPALPGQPAPASGSVAAEGRRRRRGPVLAVLAAVLTLGASTAGIAYVRAAEPGAGDPAAPVSRTADGTPGDRAAGDRAAGDRAAGDRAAGDEDGARADGHRGGGDDHESGDGDHDDDGDQDDDGQPS